MAEGRRLAKFGGKALLNGPGFHTVAAASYELFVWADEGKKTAEVRGVLAISDCGRTIHLDLSVPDNPDAPDGDGFDAWARNAAYKLQELKRIVTGAERDLRSALGVAGESRNPRPGGTS